jgi:hypothetical protein
MARRPGEEPARPPGRSRVVGLSWLTHGPRDPRAVARALLISGYRPGLGRACAARQCGASFTLSCRAAGREERVITISTTACEIRVDLQRIGRVTWLENADAWQLSSGVPPTVRLLLDDGSGLDFTESAKTKRVAVSLLPGSV